jgi:hypothetical protein
MPKLPNFFIIGAPKCGTTSLATWLAGHPSIYLSPIKEPFYFSKDIGNYWPYGWDAYVRLFNGAGPRHKAVGEASTNYLFSRVAVPSIEEVVPAARYIVMVRNPVDMAYSLHEQQLRSFNENVQDFGRAWRLSPERREGLQVPPGCKDPILLDYPAWCRLGEQLERLFSIVTHERVLVLVLDDVKENPRREYLRVLEFLDVPDDGRQEFPVFNPARAWRSPRIGRAIRALARFVAKSKHIQGWLPRRSFGFVRHLEAWNTQYRPRPPLPEDLRMELEAYFADDVRKLEELLGRKFPSWRSGPRVGI